MVTNNNYFWALLDSHSNMNDNWNDEWPSFLSVLIPFPRERNKLWLKKNMINSEMCIDLEKFCLNSFYVDFLPHYLNISYSRRTNDNYNEQTIKVK